MLWTAWSIGFPELAEHAKRYWKVAYSVIYTGESDTFEESYDLKDRRDAFSDQLFEDAMARRKAKAKK